MNSGTFATDFFRSRGIARGTGWWQREKFMCAKTLAPKLPPSGAEVIYLFRIKEIVVYIYHQYTTSTRIQYYMALQDVGGT
jgi:hypothetical protein